MIFKEGDTFFQTFVVTSKIHEGFIDLFKDKNPLHTDHSFAADKKFESIVMHGNILNGFISFFIGECLPVKNVIIHRQEIQFKNPVYLDDELIFRATAVNIYASVNAVEFSYEFKNANSKIVAKGKFQIGILE